MFEQFSTFPTPGTRNPFQQLPTPLSVPLLQHNNRWPSQPVPDPLSIITADSAVVTLSRTSSRHHPLKNQFSGSIRPFHFLLGKHTPSNQRASNLDTNPNARQKFREARSSASAQCLSDSSASAQCLLIVHGTFACLSDSPRKILQTKFVSSLPGSTFFTRHKFGETLQNAGPRCVAFQFPRKFL